jgi:hypothetical protein
MTSVDTNKLAFEMLSGTFVYKVGLESSFPLITFLNNQTNTRVTVRIDSNFKLLPEIDLPSTLCDEHRQFITLLELDSEETDSVSCGKNGDLVISFKSGRKFLIQGSPENEEIYEPWVLFNESSQAQIICQRGGDIAFVHSN